MNTMTYTRGDFSFVPSNEKRMLEDAWAAMEAVEGSWDYLAKPDIPKKEDGFMFSRDPFLAKISDQVDKNGTIGHTGSSYGWTMRQMEFIAKHGWAEYVKLRSMNKKRQNDTQEVSESTRPRLFNDSFFGMTRAMPTLQG